MSYEQIALEVVAKTDTGMVREANEDNFIVTDDCQKSEWILPKGEYINSAAGTLMVIADGMGGLNAGEVASKIVIESIHSYLYKAGAPGTDSNTKTLMTSAIVNAHEEVIQHSNEFPETEGMGSTVVMAWIRNVEAHVCWVGDSRCYLLRTGEITQISKDHSYVQSLVDQGKITKEQAFHHPESNVITQSLGDSERKPKPDYVKYALQNNDLLLLCSDGLNGMLQDNEINEIIKEKKVVSLSVDTLIENANAAGGIDNISVVLVQIISGAPEQQLIDKEHKKDKNIKRGNAGTFILLAIIAVMAVAIFILYQDRAVIKPNDKDVTEVKKNSDSAKHEMKEQSKTVILKKDTVSNSPGKNAVQKKEPQKGKETEDSNTKKVKTQVKDKRKDTSKLENKDILTIIKGQEKKDASKEPDKPSLKDTTKHDNQ